MLLHPTVRKDFITPWTDSYNNNHHSSSDLDIFPQQQLQDQQLPPNFLYDSQQSFITDDQHQPSLESPFHSPSRVHFSPSSGSTSPTFSSPVFSTTRSPVTTVSGDFPTTFEGSLLEAQPMSVVSSYDPSFHSSSQIAPAPYPATQYSTSSFPTDAPMLAQQGMVANTHSWDSDAANIQLLSPAHAQNGLARRTGFQSVHKRAASGSSGKTGSNSPHAPALRNQHSSSSFSPSGSLGSVAENFQNSNKSLPTPVQTPVHNSFLAPAFQNYDPSGQNGDNVVVEQAMRQAVMEQQHPKPQQAAADDEGSFHYSMAPSVSSLSHQNSPVTPQTTYDEFDDGSKAIVHGEDRFLDFDRWMDDYLQFDALPDFNGQGVAAIPVGVPKLNRTISDVYQDELYNTTVMPTPQVRKNPHQQLLTAPYRNLFADRLNAANQGHLSARSQSPVNNAINRERSPFRHGSPLASEFRGSRLQTSSGLGSALQLPNANGMNLQADNAGEVKTISPKDALLEYHEGPDESANGLPSLFPSNDFVSAGNLASRRSSSSTFQPTLPYTQMESFSNQYVTQAANLQQQLNYLQQPQTRHTNDSLIQQTPEFPVSLTTMESTKSESVSLDTKRPEDTSSDSGTYSCTYHGCTLRFESPAKLQKHKREAHRQAVAGQPGAVAREHSTSLALRNSQAGPHRCKQINPSTGKPCNSIFSRPYDLTRHEDTIHNARKQKVRCHLCTEEKTFSRNDALTRHMRVVHPEVDWPGKQRRKGRD